MKALLRLFLSGTLLMAQLAAVVVFTGLASLTYSYMVADSYAEGGEPTRHFPLIATVMGEPTGDYRLVRWAERGVGIALAPDRTFLLPETEGRFTLGPIRDNVSL